MKQKLFTAINAGVMLSLLLSNAALAIADIPGTESTGISNVSELVGILRQIVRWVYIIFFIVAVLLIIFAAFSYLTAGGDEEKVKGARQKIIYAAIAIIIALLSVAFETIIKNFLTSRGAS